MSTNRLQLGLGSNQTARANIDQFIIIPFECDKNLHNRADIIHNVRLQKNLKLQNGFYSLVTLEKLFQELSAAEKNGELTADEILVIEEYKLVVILAVKTHLEMHNKKIEESEKEKNSQIKDDQDAFTFKNVLKKAAFISLFLAGLVIDAMGSFLYGQTLLALIPGITNPFILAGAAVFTLASAALFYSFEAEMLRSWLGMSSLRKQNKTLLQLDSEQLDATEKINQLLITRKFSNSVNLNVYASYIRIAKQFNEQIVAKDINDRSRQKEHTETISSKILRWAVTGIGAVMTVSSGYFMATSLIGAIAVPLLGTPVGWAIVGVVMLTCLGYYACMRAQGLRSMAQEKTNRFKNVKTGLENFKDPGLDKHYQMKQRNLNTLRENFDLRAKHNGKKIENKIANTSWSNSAGLLFSASPIIEMQPLKKGSLARVNTSKFC